MTYKSPSQQRFLTPSSPSSGGRACKPASHYEPSLVIQLPSGESLASQCFNTTPRQQRRYQPQAPVSSMSATLGPSAAEHWPHPTSYWPADSSDLLAYRAATPDYQEVRYAPRDNVSAAVQVVKAHNEAEYGEQKRAVECPLEVPSDVMAAAENAEVLDTQTNTAGDIEAEANRSLAKHFSTAPLSSVEVDKDIVDDDVPAVQMSDFTHYEESLPIARSMSAEALSEDLPAFYAPADTIDILPLDELPSAVDGTVPMDSEEGKLVAFEKVTEWPPLPSAVDEVVPIDMEEKLDVGEMESELPPVPPTVDKVAPVDSEEGRLDASMESECPPLSSAVDEIIPVKTDEEILLAHETNSEWPPLPSTVDEAAPVESEDGRLDVHGMDSEWPPLPSALDEADPGETDEEILDADKMDTEWPPLPSDEELQVSRAELELSDDEDELDLVESEVAGPGTASEVSAGAEAGVLTKVGASEKILARVTDVDSMHRLM